MAEKVILAAAMAAALGNEKCSRLHALTAEARLRFHLSQSQVDQSTAETATRITRNKLVRTTKPLYTGI